MQPSFFNQLNNEQLQNILALDCVKTRSYQKGQFVHKMGDLIDEMGWVQSGCVHVVTYDLQGNENILSVTKQGQTFGQAYTLNAQKMMVYVVASEPSEIVFVNVAKLLSSNLDTETKNVLLTNMLRVLAHNSLQLAQRIFCTTPKTIRLKLVTYLNAMRTKYESNAFDIQLNRQQLANYLNVERSALSNELCKMRNDGLITFYKNHFTLLYDE